MTNGPGKSDRPTVPGKSPNNAGQPAAEGTEGKGLAKGNLPQQNASRTPSRADAPSALERVRQAAGKDKKLRFTALLRHIYNLETLRMAYFRLKKEAAPGVDGETWRHYGETLEGNLQDLAERLKRGAYRAKPVRRVFIPKADGRQRPLGVPALEDKIVQRAAVEVLNAIYETDFLDFSYGFRPGRSQHQALDALYTGLLTKKVNWVLDLDIKGFFDGLSHEWLVKFVEHRVADRRVVRLIQKWLSAGVLEDGKRIRTEEGTPQGGSASPLLANVYLHYVFDLWVQAWRQKRAHGDVIVVRFADDIVVGFHSKAEADQFRAELTERMKKFHLELHLQKSRLLGMQFQVELLHTFRKFRSELIGLRFAVESHHDVIREAHHDNIAVCPLLTPRLDPQIEYVMKIDVGQKRRSTATLGRPFLRPYSFPILQHAGAQPFLDEPHDAPICHPMLNELHKPFVGKSIEKAFDVQIEHPVHFLRQQSRVQRVQRLMLATPWSEPVRKIEKVRFVDSIQHLDRRALDDFVFQRRDPERSLPRWDRTQALYRWAAGSCRYRLLIGTCRCLVPRLDQFPTSPRFIPDGGIAPVRMGPAAIPLYPRPRDPPREARSHVPWVSPRDVSRPSVAIETELVHRCQ